MANLRFQKALKREAQSVPPIWFMRQAGRYHRHYQNLRSQHSFMDLCKVPELAAETALGPIADFDFDVAILFSDLLFPLEALGMGLAYTEQGPRLGWELTPDSITRLASVDEALPQLKFQAEALKLTRQKLPQNKSLIGFVGGPFTLFSYACQGSHDGSLIKSKVALPLFEKFCESMIPLLKGNITLQIEAGAEVVMLFDTSAGELSPQVFTHYVVPQLQKLAESFPGKLGYYSKGTQNQHLESPLFHGKLWAGLGFDHRWPLAQRFGQHPHGFIQGNFDQALLFMDPKHLQHEIMRFLEPMQALEPEKRAAWVCGLGHGVLPKTPEDNVRLFVQTVRKVLG